MEYYTNLTTEKIESLNLSTIKTPKKGEYFNIECALDIETTSTYISGVKFAFPYIWQFGIGLNNPVYYGRTFEELVEFLDFISTVLEITPERKLIIYVHNLGYEFQFMRKWFEWENVFSVAERKPIKAETKQGIEFKDSYILSGYSLANTAKNLTKYKVEKMVGDLDYSLIRHHKTPLNDKEMKYCENDILVILSYIKEQIELAGDISKIPLTNTGRVRKYVRDNCLYTSKSHKKTNKGKYFRYRKIMGDLTLEPEVYIQLKTAFMGGFTHSNPMYTNKTLKNVDSVDLTSSYPTVMLAEMFPMSRAREIKFNNLDELKKQFYKHNVLMDVKFTNIKNKIHFESYISESKCRNLKNPTEVNGRIYEADSLEMTITEIDFSIIENVYSWDEIQVKNVRAFVKNYLPKSIIESILKLYEDKTVLKDVEGYETEYLLSKGMLNSVYGMAVTDVVKEETTYINDKWNVELPDFEEHIEKYNKSKNRVLYYPWGVWVTAYARKNLWEAILNIGEDYIYSDTDSVKMLNYEKHKKYINNYNYRIMKKLEKMAKYYKLNPDLFRPKSQKGIEKPLGIWEHEGHYELFKTLGAKRYLLKCGDKLELTVAGLSKSNGIKHLKDNSENDLQLFDNFTNQLYVPACETGKMTHTYIDEELTSMITDYLGETEEVHSKSSIHLENCDFTLSTSRKFLDFLDNFTKGYIFKGDKNL